MTRSLTQLFGSFLVTMLTSTLGLTSTFQTRCAMAQETGAVKKVQVESLSSRTAGVDWPIFLGPQRDSKSTEKGILRDWSGDKLRVVWKRPLDTGYSMGVVSAGRYFHFERQADTAKLLCLHAETGEELWSFGYETEYVDTYGYNNGPRCSPIIDEDRVYIFGVEGMLHCLNTMTGELIWNLDTAETFGVVQNFFGVGSTPVLEGDLLIVMIGGASPATRDLPTARLNLVEGDRSGIVAFDKRTGEIKYQITDQLASYASLTTATIEGRRWCFAFARGGLVGFEPLSGKVDFEFPWRARILESVNASTPVVIDDTVFISETYGPGSALLKIRPAGFDIVWQDDLRKRDKAMQTHWNTAVHHDGYLYGCSGRHTSTAELRCIELATGKVMWTLEGMSRSSLMFVDGHFVCLGEYGELFLFNANPDNFELITQWEHSAPLHLGDEPTSEVMLEYPCWAAPILSQGLLYVRGSNQLVCLELIPERKTD